MQCKRHWFNPWSGNMPHAMEQLSPRAPTTEPALQSLGKQLPSPCAATPEACEPWGPSFTRRKATTTRRREARGPQLERSPTTAKNKNKFNKKENHTEATSQALLAPKFHVCPGSCYQSGFLSGKQQKQTPANLSRKAIY